MLWQHVGHPVIRALRAAVFTAVCVLASAALHVLVGGGGMRPGGPAAATWADGTSGLPGWLWAALAVVLAGGAAVVFAARRKPRPGRR